MTDYNVRQESIESVLSKKYFVPDYQREYRWKESAVETLWNDLLDAAQPNRRNRKYLLGPLVELDHGSKSEIVDGQQRLVTLSLLFRAMEGALREYLYDNNGSAVGEPIKAELDEVKGHITLDHNANNDTLKNIGKHVSTNRLTATQKNLIKNYDKLYQLSKSFYEIHKLNNSDKYKNGLKEIQAIVKNIKKNVIFVLITIPSHDDVYTIFQSLNSKSTPLAQAELIKSHLMAISNRSDRPNISIRWKNMLSDISKPDKALYQSMLSRDSRDIQEKRLYETVRQKYRSGKVDEYLEEVNTDLEIIKKLNKPKNVSDPKLKYVLFCLEKVSAIYFRRVVIVAMRKWGHYNKKTIELIEFLVKFFFMYRTICKKDITPLRASSKRAADQIESGCEPEQIFWTILMDDERSGHRERIEQDKFIEKFKEALLAFETRIALYILISLEHDYEASDIQYPIDTLQLEHIFPRHPNMADWPDKDANKKHTKRLGNLTLVTTEWNPALSNSSFVKKLCGDGNHDSKCYNNSGLELNRSLKQYKKWTSAEMSKREEQLLSKVSEIWNMKCYAERAKKFEPKK